MYEHENKPGVLKPLLILALTIAGVAYFVGWLNTGNPLWLLPTQPDYNPSRIVIRDAGRVETYEPGNVAFDALAAALDESLSAFGNADLTPIGLSDITLSEYEVDGLVVEVYYPTDIQFNTPARMDSINQLLIPYRGRHAGSQYAFVGSDGRWTAGALIMESDEALKQALRRLGHTDIEE
jgi:hypothetical protein